MNKKGLIISLCSIGLAGVVAAIVLPLTMCNKNIYTFTSGEQLREFLSNNAKEYDDGVLNVPIGGECTEEAKKYFIDEKRLDGYNLFLNFFNLYEPTEENPIKLKIISKMLFGSFEFMDDFHEEHDYYTINKGAKWSVEFSKDYTVHYVISGFPEEMKINRNNDFEINKIEILPVVDDENAFMYKVSNTIKNENFRTNFKKSNFKGVNFTN